MTFCRVCGTKKELVDMPGYNEKTGEKNKKEECPVSPCHNGKHKYKYNWAGLIKLGSPYQICQVCGDEVYSEF